MRFIILGFLLLCSSFAEESRWKKLGIEGKMPIEALQLIEGYEKNFNSSIKKLSDESFKVRREGKVFFKKMPALPKKILMKAFADVEDIEAKENLREIVKTFSEKQDFETWKSDVLFLLTESVIKNSGDTAVLLKIASANRSAALQEEIESEFLKRSSKENFLEIYKKSDDKIKSCLFGAVKSKLSEEQVKSALSSKNNNLKLKAAVLLINKEQSNTLMTLVELLTSEEEVADKSAGYLRAATGQNYNFSGYDKLAVRQEKQKTWKKWLTENKDIKIKRPLVLERMTFLSFTKKILLFSSGYTAGNSCALKFKGRFIFDDKKRIGQRGLNVFAVSAGGKTLLLKSYDTWENKENSDQMAKDIEALPKGAFVVIIARDEASTNLTDKAVDAIKSIGGKGTLKGRYRAAYYCIGQKGLAEGKAVESDTTEQGPLYYPADAKGKLKFFKNPLHPDDAELDREEQFEELIDKVRF